MQLAPIALFTYNRLQHTRLTIEALAANEMASESELYLFSDAPRTDAQHEAVHQVRDFLHTISGFKSVTVIERETNLGLANSIIDGVTRLTESHGRVVVLEDDLFTSPYFLRYMNEALEMYATDEQVISIHGYVYPLKKHVPELFFIRGADCWGWATWQRGWRLFDKDGSKLLDRLREQKLERKFNFDNSYPYMKMLEDQVNGINNSWAIRWNAAAFLENRLTLYPGHSLVRNIGFDESGTHCGANENFDVVLANHPVSMKRIALIESVEGTRAFRHFFLSLKSGFFKRLKRSILKRLNRIGM